MNGRRFVAAVAVSLTIASTSNFATSLDFESWAQAASMCDERLREFMPRFAT